ncbi:MAG: J domain-containing protein [Gloeocapsa sp. DLM2.Bin57]|nr:MAG: J domain-containing protein [Gloeocapsa sp. DLM2.Bin57]
MATVVNSVGTMGVIFTGLCLFIIFFSFTCWFFYGLKVEYPPNSDYLLKGQFSPLACFWEDAPSPALQGQAYHLATPIACIVTKTWLNFYRENLGKPGVNYWEWLNFPESNQVCAELSALLTLKPPTSEVNSILMLLPSQPLQPFTEGDFWQQTHNYYLFKDWHQTSCKILGKATLEKVYQVCFNISWQTVNEILTLHQQKQLSWWQILNITATAEADEVETAYKGLIRYWHPDINSSPYANQFATMINLAYEEYSNLPPPRRLNSFFEFLYQIYAFLANLKPLKLFLKVSKN